jgi:hypothetical protein
MATHFNYLSPRATLKVRKEEFVFLLTTYALTPALSQKEREIWISQSADSPAEKHNQNCAADNQPIANEDPRRVRL